MDKVEDLELLFSFVRGRSVPARIPVSLPVSSSLIDIVSSCKLCPGLAPDQSCSLCVLLSPAISLVKSWNPVSSHVCVT